MPLIANVTLDEPANLISFGIYTGASKITGGLLTSVDGTHYFAQTMIFDGTYSFLFLQ